ncbi:hypothetical protein [Clostridium botulinum]|uniref:hypothetical protein n=1 Tax=Clostridium botulinum TaxID=1491 RepID=UPI001E625791|nr:hypothetical protein [Clostridium botulinum]MCD3330996.1 hypothetical protein [Clostridium botulinum D/C]MCD3337003.1 hypothetical protein [Clostridium botulinum D/C]MCD3345823.1 hypothetical protein [Clostridium botulinum D/C]MCD3354612.1 hypothetical protein [Clostridium botulinum D/C]
MNNKIKIYEIANPALEMYREKAKKGSKVSRDVINKKLSAMIYHAETEGELLKYKKIYRIFGFFMVVNTRTDKIEVVGWDKDNHGNSNYKRFNRELGKDLEQTYRLLGLNKSGNNYTIA